MARLPKPNCSEKQPEDRVGVHPMAVPFLWLGDKRVVKNFIYVPLIATLILSILGFVYPHHHPAPWDFFASYAVIGIVAYTFVVLASWPLFRWLSRDGNYYGEGDDD